METVALPTDVQLERSLLGAILTDPNNLYDATEFLATTDFFHPVDQLIWQAVLHLDERSQAIDIVSVSHHLERDGDLEKAGGRAFIGSLLDGVARSANVRSYARAIRELSVRRQIIAAAEDMRERAVQGGADTDDLLEAADEQLLSLSRSQGEGVSETAAEVADRYMGELYARRKAGGSLVGITSGFDALDRITGGFRPGEFVVLGGRPSMGKTLLAGCMAMAAARAGHGVGFLSLEMSKDALVERMTAAESGLTLDSLRAGMLTDEAYDTACEALSRITALPIVLDDQGALTPVQARAKARRMVIRHKVKMIVVDYLQLMRIPGMRAGNRTEEVTRISGALKEVAKHLSIPIIALCQLSRGLESRPDDQKEPRLADLRDSGAIEQDADIVLFIFRPEQYARSDDAKQRLRGQARLIVAKQRNGRLGRVDLDFDGPRQRFTECFRAKGF